jgi:hypothetical protein
MTETHAPVREEEPEKGHLRLWIFLAAAWLLVYAYRFVLYGDFERDEIGNSYFTVALLDGIAHSAAHYQYGASHGSLVYGALLTPIFYLAGSRLLWIKLLGALFVAGGLALWTHNLNRAFGFAPAALFALFCIVPPPFFEWSMHCAFWGNHLESIFFSGLLFFLFLRFRHDAPTAMSNAVFWLLAGFACFFCLQNVPLAIAFAFAFAWKWPGRTAVRLLAPGAVFFFLAFSPHFFMRGIGVDLPAEPQVARVGTKLSALLFEHLPIAAGYDAARAPVVQSILLALARPARHFELENFAGRVLTQPPLMSLAFFGLAVAGIVLVASPALRRAKARESWFCRVLLLYGSAWLLLYGLSRTQFDFRGGINPRKYMIGFMADRYLLPIFPLLLTFVCVRVTRFSRGVRALAAGALLASGLLHLAAYHPGAPDGLADKWRNLMSRRGDDYREIIGCGFDYDWAIRPDAVSLEIGRLPQRWQDAAWTMYGAKEAMQSYVDRKFDESLWPPAIRERLVAGEGATLGRDIFALWYLHDPPRRGRIDKVVARVAGFDKTLAERFAEGIGEGIFFTAMISYRQARIVACSTGVGPPASDDDCFKPLDLHDWRTRVPQLSADEFYVAFLRGAGRGLWRHVAPWEGSRAPAGPAKQPWTADDTRRFCEYWAAALHTTAAPLAVESFRRGFSEGRADYLIRTARRFVFTDQADDLPALRDALAARHVGLRPTNKRPNEYALDSL